MTEETNWHPLRAVRQLKQLRKIQTAKEKRRKILLKEYSFITAKRILRNMSRQRIATAEPTVVAKAVYWAFLDLQRKEKLLFQGEEK